MNADSKQVGGEHYKKKDNRLQHWNVVAEIGWDYFIGNATKYLWRLGEKGGPEKAVEDISKAIHYLEKKRELMIAALPSPTIPGFIDPRVPPAPHPYNGEPGPEYVNQDR